MTAKFTVQLMCECALCTSISQHGCHVSFPSRPEEKHARDLRAIAKDQGWEVLRHTTGRDVCPPCRIAEISQKAALCEPAGVREPA